MRSTDTVKFVGCELNAKDTARIESALAKRIAQGRTSSRASLIREAIRLAYPIPAEFPIREPAEA